MTKTFCDRCGKEPVIYNNPMFVFSEEPNNAEPTFLVSVARYKQISPGCEAERADLCRQCIADVILGRPLIREGEPT